MGIGVIGYSIIQSQWGRGYATEAVGVIANRTSSLGLRSLQASTVTDNLASQRVLQKLGFGLSETGIMEKAMHGPAREVHI